MKKYHTRVLSGTLKNLGRVTGCINCLEGSQGHVFIINTNFQLFIHRIVMCTYIILEKLINVPSLFTFRDITILFQIKDLHRELFTEIEVCLLHMLCVYLFYFIFFGGEVNFV